MPDELLDDFDDVILEKKVAGELDRDTSRSEVIQDLMADWIEKHESGENRPTARTAD
jgi:metal-responsive CopG/Arc/MetJ family transcriptional regulator